MKKLFAVLIAATVLAAPLAQAQGRNDYRPDHRGQDSRQEYRPDRGRHAAPPKRVIIKKHRWDRGQRLSAAQRRNYIDQREYRRYKLSAPRRDQRWVRVDDQFLLINAVTGLIVGLSSAR